MEPLSSKEILRVDSWPPSWFGPLSGSLRQHWGPQGSRVPRWSASVMGTWRVRFLRLGLVCDLGQGHQLLWACSPARWGLRLAHISPRAVVRINQEGGSLEPWMPAFSACSCGHYAGLCPCDSEASNLGRVNSISCDALGAQLRPEVMMHSPIQPPWAQSWECDLHLTPCLFLFFFFF